MDNLTNIILENENLIYKIISKYSTYYDIDDLYQVGVMGMIKAYNDYYNLKKRILEIDPSAFMIIDKCYEVNGGVKRSNIPFL